MFKRSLLVVSMVGLLGVFAACGGSDGGNYPAHEDQPLQGTIDGEDWEYGAASATVSDDELSLEVYGSDVDEPCGAVQSEEWKIITSLPAAEERHELEVSLTDEDAQSVTFAKDGNNVIIGNGFIEVTSLGESTVEVDLVADQDEENTVNGSFEATRCDNQDNGS